jgi:hypothetical protein
MKQVVKSTGFDDEIRKLLTEGDLWPDSRSTRNPHAFHSEHVTSVLLWNISCFTVLLTAMYSPVVRLDNQQSNKHEAAETWFPGPQLH